METVIDVWAFITRWKFLDVLMVLLTVIMTVIVYRFATKQMFAYAVQRAYTQESVLKFMFVWRYIFMFIAAVLIIMAFSGSLSTLGLSLAFISTLLSWALQNPIMNLSAWLLIMLRHPFKVGERIIIGDITGDVKDISLTYIRLEQVGGTIGGEEKSGRTLLVPNSYLFSRTVVNYTLNEKYILDEVPVRLTYDSDYFLAEEILLKAAHQVVSDVIEETGDLPYVQVEFIPSGLVARLRYKVPPVERQRISSEIVEIIFREFNKAEKVRFCYIQSEASLASKDRSALPPPQHPVWLQNSLTRP